ncbi:MAG: DUF5696 domain-containing protein [Planctomycetota bacterium]
MATKSRIELRNSDLKVSIDPRSLATDVTVLATGETLKMAGAQPDDVMLTTTAGPVWTSFADSPIVCNRLDDKLIALVPGAGLRITMSLNGPAINYVIEPLDTAVDVVARDVLYPRHFILPKKSDAYAVFPFGQGCILPSNKNWNFHHREGYAEAVMHWVGGYTGKTGYIQIAETPHDLYQAVDERPGQAASCFIHWLGSLGKLSYARKTSIRFGAGLDYVKQAKIYRDWTKAIGWYKSLKDKVAENPNVEQLRGAPIVTVPIASRSERTQTFNCQTFKQATTLVDQFHKKTGIKRAVVHVDGWCYWGYDSMHPDCLPPSPDAGGAKGLKEMSKRVKGMGYLFGLHDQYIDYYAHAPSYNESNGIVLEDGSPVRVNRWCGGLCNHLHYGFIPAFVKRNYFDGIRKVYPIYANSPSIWDICEPTASYLDCFNRTVEDFSPQHPMTREQSRRWQIESISIVRNGKDGKMIVQSNEHPRDYCLSQLEFGWSIGHMMTDIPNTTGVMTTTDLGVNVPLWHLCYHDALALPMPSDDFPLMFLYGQAPYFMLGRRESFEDSFIEKDKDGNDKAVNFYTDIKKNILKLHSDIGFAEMTDFQILSADGNLCKSVFDSGLEVEVNKKENTYKISSGKAKTKGTEKIG